MAKVAWTSPGWGGSDAGFRAACSELSAKLQSMPGLVKTADTGQINFSTVSRPGGGYEIYYLNDSLHATAPIYIKITYATNNVSFSQINLWFEVGTGSNGAGTLTGLGSGYSDAMLVTGNNNVSGNSFPSYLCVTEGFLGLSWKVGLGSYCWMTLSRTCGVDGLPNATGMMYMTRGSNINNGNYARCFRYASPATAYTLQTSSNYSHVGAGTTADLPDKSKQIYRVWGSFPDMQPMFSVVTGVASYFPSGHTYRKTIMGSVERTFIATPVTSIANLSGSYNLHFLWE